MCTFVPMDIQIFTDEGLIFASCKSICITIFMLSCLNSKLQVKERELLGDSNE